MDGSKASMGASHNSDALLNTSVSRYSGVGNHTASPARPVSAVSAPWKEGGGAARSVAPPPRIYANQAPVHPSRMSRPPRPIQIFNPSTESECLSGWLSVCLSVCPGRSGPYRSSTPALKVSVCLSVWLAGW